jgi:hypothetical protein
MIASIPEDRVFVVTISADVIYQIAAFEDVHDAAAFISLLGVSCSLEQETRSLVQCKVTPKYFYRN